METWFGLLLVLITLAIIHIVQAQDQQGFISFDCGLPEDKTSPYKDTRTGLWFSSDKEFIQSGRTGRIQGNPQGYAEPYLTVRYFPEGIRNCYNLRVERGRKYLIRASFFYGNYDGQEINPVFDLYLGPNPWATIDLKRLVNGTVKEILHIPTSNSLQICLVKNGTTTPVISALELRPTGNNSYITDSGSLELFFRRYLNESKFQLRYPNDVYDRHWIPYFQKEWSQISSPLEVNNNNYYDPPIVALATAAIPTNASEPLTIAWTNSDNPDDQYYLYAHFAEIQDLQANDTRESKILFNGRRFYGPLNTDKVKMTTIYSRSLETCNGGKCSFQLTRTNKSTLPPLLNAFEFAIALILIPSLRDSSWNLIRVKKKKKSELVMLRIHHYPKRAFSLYSSSR